MNTFFSFFGSFFWPLAELRGEDTCNSGDQEGYNILLPTMTLDACSHRFTWCRYFGRFLTSSRFSSRVRFSLEDSGHIHTAPPLYELIKWLLPPSLSSACQWTSVVAGVGAAPVALPEERLGFCFCSLASRSLRFPLPDLCGSSATSSFPQEHLNCACSRVQTSTRPPPLAPRPVPTHAGPWWPPPSSSRLSAPVWPSSSCLREHSTRDAPPPVVLLRVAS